jgi:hypothetical protein
VLIHILKANVQVTLTHLGYATDLEWLWLRISSHAPPLIRVFVFVFLSCHPSCREPFAPDPTFLCWRLLHRYGNERAQRCVPICVVLLSWRLIVTLFSCIEILVLDRRALPRLRSEAATFCMFFLYYSAHTRGAVCVLWSMLLSLSCCGDARTLFSGVFTPV